GTLRRGDVLPAARSQGARHRRPPIRTFYPRREAGAARLARRTGQRRGPRPNSDRRDAADPPGDRRPRTEDARSRHLRAQNPRRSQADPKSAAGAREETQAAVNHEFLHAVLLDAYGRLQGAAARTAGGTVL